MKAFCLALGMILVAPLGWTHTVGVSYGNGGGQQPTSSMSFRYQSGLVKLNNGSLMLSLGGRLSSLSKNSTIDLGESKHQISTLAVQMINVMFAVDYDIWQDLGLGMNIDLLGASFGAEQDLRLLSGASTKAKPTQTNVFLVAKNDRGSLNSEFYLSYRFLNLSLRGGLSHQVVEYEASVSTEKLQRFYDLFFVSLDMKL